MPYSTALFARITLCGRSDGGSPSMHSQISAEPDRFFCAIAEAHAMQSYHEHSSSETFLRSPSKRSYCPRNKTERNGKTAIWKQEPGFIHPRNSALGAKARPVRMSVVHSTELRDYLSLAKEDMRPRSMAKNSVTRSSRRNGCPDAGEEKYGWRAMKP